MSRYQRIREILYYSLGVVLVGGFISLYFSRFLFRSSMPPAILQLLVSLGRDWTIAINAAVFILFLLFLPALDRQALEERVFRLHPGADGGDVWFSAAFVCSFPDSTLAGTGLNAALAVGWLAGLADQG